MNIFYKVLAVVLVLLHAVGVTIILVFVFGLGEARAADLEPLTTTEIQKELALGALLVLDRAQTRDIHGFCVGRTDCTIHETNPLLGTDPSPNRIRNYFLGTALVHVAVLYLLPREYRSYWQNGALALEVGVVASNYHLGLRARF